MYSSSAIISLGDYKLEDYNRRFKEAEEEVLRSSSHADVVRADEYHAGGVFVGAGTTSLVFWTNDREFDPVRGIEVSWGQEIAVAYCRAHDGAHVMGDFEGPAAFCGDRGVVSLNDYDRRRDISRSIKDGVAVMASYSFAKSASGTIVAAARGAFPDSYFREIELDTLMNNDAVTLMNNDAVTHMTLISRVAPLERTGIPKHEAYHTLRDEWLQYNYERCQQSRDIYDRAPPPDNLKSYNKSLEDLSTEILIAEKSMSSPYPTVRDGGATEGKAREGARYLRGRGYLAEFPALKAAKSLEHKLKNPHEWRKPSKKVAIIKAIEVRRAALAPARIGVGHGRAPAARTDRLVELLIEGKGALPGHDGRSLHATGAAAGVGGRAHGGAGR